ncbi:DUF4867 family protein [Paenibacillus alkaliterrae]|uniref:DUF4867 family protein n=1 Tax=Paenibacillus alkaliterrae TaxID=320909 RepID=UPI001F3D28F9|nr:DUF4867 family protein [Paenibacillus alkaliterrae]MCF2941258.1 DUF4867 family protein [Paenibacillus alkaliterrae]
MGDRLRSIQQLNSEIRLHYIDDEAFRSFGKVLTGYDFSEIIAVMNNTSIPEDGNCYIASVNELEATAVKEQVQSGVYGSMDIQIGYCNGMNSNLNGLEYHKGSEINVAVTDLVLLLGSVQDIVHNQFSVKGVQGFYIPQGTAVELYQTTLHFAPCKVSESGFKCIVILPKGTNEPLPHKAADVTEEDKLLFMRNKWLLAHPERQVLIDKGAYPGIDGPNLRVNY